MRILWWSIITKKLGTVCTFIKASCAQQLCLRIFLNDHLSGTFRRRWKRSIADIFPARLDICEMERELLEVVQLYSWFFEGHKGFSFGKFQRNPHLNLSVSLLHLLMSSCHLSSTVIQMKLLIVTGLLMTLECWKKIDEQALLTFSNYFSLFTVI